MEPTRVERRKRERRQGERRQGERRQGDRRRVDRIDDLKQVRDTIRAWKALKSERAQQKRSARRLFRRRRA
jgi:hypothetical protein